MVYIFLAMVCYAVAIVVAAAAARNANSNLAAAVTNLVSAAIPVLAVIPILSKKILVNQKFGIMLAAMSGVLIAVFVMSINKAYAVNKVGVVAPVVFGGAIFLSTLISLVVFKEKISLLQLSGLVLLGLGFVVIIYARAIGK